MKSYDGAYTKDYIKAYTGTFDNTWEHAYTKSYDKVWSKIWAGGVYYGGFSDGSNSQSYGADYTATYLRDYVKAYGATYTGTYTKTYQKIYVGTYNKEYVKDYITTYESRAFSREVEVSYLGTAETTGVAGSGGAGWNIGLAGRTESPDVHLLRTPKDGNIFDGGDRGIPDWQFGNSRAISGSGGNLGNVGTGGGERFMRKTRFARSGDGGQPGAAIKGYDSEYVTMIYQGNILGDSNYMFQS